MKLETMLSPSTGYNLVLILPNLGQQFSEKRWMFFEILSQFFNLLKRGQGKFKKTGTVRSYIGYNMVSFSWNLYAFLSKQFGREKIN